MAPVHAGRDRQAVQDRRLDLAALLQLLLDQRRIKDRPGQGHKEMRVAALAPRELLIKGGERPGIIEPRRASVAETSEQGDEAFAAPGLDQRGHNEVIHEREFAPETVDGEPFHIGIGQGTRGLPATEDQQIANHAVVLHLLGGQRGHPADQFIVFRVSPDQGEGTGRGLEFALRMIVEEFERTGQCSVHPDLLRGTLQGHTADDDREGIFLFGKAADVGMAGQCVHGRHRIAASSGICARGPLACVAGHRHDLARVRPDLFLNGVRMDWQLAPEWEQRISDAAASLHERGFGIDARLGLVLGSGLGGVVDAMEISAEASFDEVRGFASASVKAHAGRVLQVRASGQEFLVLQGRPHAYEGLPLADVVLPVAVLERLGCSVVVLTNAAGGLRPQMVAGELAVLDDVVDLHLDDVARGILMPDPGINAGLFARAARPGVIFDPVLGACLEQAARSNGIGLRRASYASVWGPNYEESATIGWLRRIGADVVGMSTGPEAAYLKAVGVRVAGLSCITNVAVEHGAAEVSHDEVVQVGGESGTEFSTLLLAALPELIALAGGKR